MLSYVVAISQNNVIGREGKLPWHLPNDVKFFKETTLTGTKTMIMGRKTYESLPKVLPDRKHIVFSRNESFEVLDEDVVVVRSLEELIKLARVPEEYFVIGGEQIFKLLFPYTDRLYLTEIHKDFAGDTFFPMYDRAEWEIAKSWPGIVDADNLYAHTFFILNRKKKTYEANT